MLSLDNDKKFLKSNWKSTPNDMLISDKNY